MMFFSVGGVNFVSYMYICFGANYNDTPLGKKGVVDAC